MEALSVNIAIPKNLHLRNPQDTDLGKRILTESINAFSELGFEGFTFKKLASRIGSTESSIYRYFTNKQMLLSYLACWYYTWLELRLILGLANMECPEAKLRKALRITTGLTGPDERFGFIDESRLQRIIIEEGVKSYHTKKVDDLNSQGYFVVYKRLVQRICDIVTEINPAYRYPHNLITMILEGALQQRFFADHLPKLTDLDGSDDDIQDFVEDTVFSAISVNGGTYHNKTSA